MDATIDHAAHVVGLLEGQGPCTAPLDATVEYLRTRLDRVLPLYVLAMAPHAYVMSEIITAIAGRRAGRLSEYCVELVLATVWRWVWLSRLQYVVQQDLLARSTTGFWRRLGPILLVRLFSNFALTWGSLLAGVPAFYGLYVGSFAAPLILESNEPVLPRLRTALSWIQHSGRRLFRVLLAMLAIITTVTVSIFVSQLILAGSWLPSILGMNTADLNVTLDGWAWRLSVFYFLFLLFDAFWSVASVILFYDSQSRRMATDLRSRLLRVTQGAE